MDATWIIALGVGLAMLVAGTLLQYLESRRRGEPKQDVWRSISDQWGLKEAREMVTDRGMAAWVVCVVLFASYSAWLSNSLRFQIFTGVVLIGSGLGGWSIRRRFRTRSLGPYGVAFLIGFFLLVWVPIR